MLVDPLYSTYETIAGREWPDFCHLVNSISFPLGSPFPTAYTAYAGDIEATASASAAASSGTSILDEFLERLLPLDEGEFFWDPFPLPATVEISVTGWSLSVRVKITGARMSQTFLSPTLPSEVEYDASDVVSTQATVRTTYVYQVWRPDEWGPFDEVTPTEKTHVVTRPISMGATFSLKATSLNSITLTVNPSVSGSDAFTRGESTVICSTALMGFLSAPMAIPAIA